MVVSEPSRLSPAPAPVVKRIFVTFPCGGKNMKQNKMGRIVLEGSSKLKVEL